MQHQPIFKLHPVRLPVEPPLVPNSARPAETKLCTRVARGKILTITERFSEFNSYNACNDVIDGKKIELASLQF